MGNSGRRGHTAVEGAGHMVGLTPLERDIIQLLTQHISCNEEISLTELAEECHVAKSTVVKAVQKLGYGGFGDLTYNIRLNAQSAGGLLPRRPVSGDVDDQVDRLSRLLWSCRDKHSILFSGDHRIGAPLSSYMCRKLAMFGIFASASYDYLMVEHHALDPGTAIFFFHRELPGRANWGQTSGYGEGMLRAARDAGFSIVAFSDDPEKSTRVQADLCIAIDSRDDAGGDLYMMRVLMVFEMALARISKGL